MNKKTLLVIVRSLVGISIMIWLDWRIAVGVYLFVGANNAYIINEIKDLITKK